MKTIPKGSPMAPVLYSLPLHDNNYRVPEHFLLMQELSNKKAVYDHFGVRYADGEHLVIFYDDYSNPTPQVVKAFLGHLEFIGYTFETDQQFGYKFTPISIVDVFLQDTDFHEPFQDFKPMFYSFKQPKNLSNENYNNTDSIDQIAGPAE